MTTHQQLLSRAAQIIPVLSPKLYKGQAGRIGVLGGSKDYAGAPYFAAMAALRNGADLSHVICDTDAGAVIKTYSPDLIVHTDLSPEKSNETTTKALTSILSRLHCLIIGPGLGRDDYMLSAARIAINEARKLNLFLVIDADGLFLISKEPELIKGYKRAVLTPNVVEFKRLCDAVKIDISTQENADSESLASRLANALDGVTILQKGSSDIITNGFQSYINSIPGSNRRCGGQGDILSGSVGAWCGFTKNYLERNEKTMDESEAILLSCYAASTLTRECSKASFMKKKRAMQSSDLLEEIGEVFDVSFGQDREVSKLFDNLFGEEKEGSKL